MFAEKFTHLKKAKALLEKGDPDSLRYACLEMRFCLELLAYELIELHEKELPEEVFQVWQPKRVIEELLTFDPDIEKDSVISVGFEGSAGEPPKQMLVLGEEKGLTRKFIGKHHGKLSSFLHAPTFAKLRSGASLDKAAVAAYLQELVPEVETLCLSPRSNLAMFVTFECRACKKTIVRNHESLAEGAIVTCTKTGCGATYTVSGLDTHTPSLEMLQIEFECPACNTKNFLDKHLLRHGATITCVACPKKIAVTLVWRLSLPDEITAPPA